MNENDSVRIDYSMADQKNVKVNPISAGAKWDSNKKQIVVSGKEAIEAVNKGESTFFSLVINQHSKTMRMQLLCR